MITLTDFTPENNRTSDPKRELYHIFEDDDIAALWAAYAAQRPLLVRGRPGTGKSQMAKAMANHLEWAFVSCVIRGDTELSELHYYFDAVARLGEAQAQGNNADREKLDALLYLSPGPFWWAYNWQSASSQYKNCSTRMKPRPYCPGEKLGDEPPAGVVLLIDEIDKANPDLPNGLLETIGERTFTVPYLPEKTENVNGPDNPIVAGLVPLLIIITTNEERELPTAFVRRCFVHTLKMNEDHLSTENDPEEISGAKKSLTAREQWLIDRGRFRFGDSIVDDAYRKAAVLLWRDREDKVRNKRYPPGLAEYIDLLTVLTKVDVAHQASFIDRIASYAFEKELAD